jgi:hypothetical protein
MSPVEKALWYIEGNLRLDISLADIAAGADDEYERLKALDVQMLDDRVVVEGPLKLFRFADPDGNAPELFSLHA